MRREALIAAMLVCAILIPRSVLGKPATPPNYIYAEDGTYYYAAAITQRQRAAGVVAGDAVGYRFYGKNVSGEYVLASVSGGGQITGLVYCKNPCRVIRTSGGARFVNNGRLLVGSAFADAIRGKLINTNPELVRPRIKPVSIPSRPPYQGTVSAAGITKAPTGILIRATPNAPVYATADGVVEVAGPMQGYGNAVRIDHGAQIETVYGNLGKVIVTPASSVTKGQIIGYLGDELAGGRPELFYEVRITNKPVNPIPYLNSNDEEFKRFFQEWKDQDGR